MSGTLCTTIMLAGSGRIRLLQQALRSYEQTTPVQGHSLIVVVDNEKVNDAVCACMRSSLGEHRLEDHVLNTASAGQLGALRNTAAHIAQLVYRSDYLHFVDDDVYFREGWFDQLYRTLVQSWQIAIVGGDRHPYHKPNALMKGTAFETTDAVAGYSMFMSTTTYSRLGGFPYEGKGIGASEDWAICQKARRSGMVVGYSTARPVLHCGLTNSNGQPATGADQILANKPTDEDVKGVIYE